MKPIFHHVFQAPQDDAVLGFLDQQRAAASEAEPLADLGRQAHPTVWRDRHLHRHGTAPDVANTSRSVRVSQFREHMPQNLKRVTNSATWHDRLV